MGLNAAADGSLVSRKRFVPARNIGPMCFHGRNLQSFGVNPHREVRNLWVPCPEQRGVNFTASPTGLCPIAVPKALRTGR